MAKSLRKRSLKNRRKSTKTRNRRYKRGGMFESLFKKPSPTENTKTPLNTVYSKYTKYTDTDIPIVPSNGNLYNVNGQEMDRYSNVIYSTNYNFKQIFNKDNILVGLLVKKGINDNQMNDNQMNDNQMNYNQINDIWDNFSKKYNILNTLNEYKIYNKEMNYGYDESNIQTADVIINVTKEKNLKEFANLYKIPNDWTKYYIYYE
jgi:hypothetical protein